MGITELTTSRDARRAILITAVSIATVSLVIEVATSDLGTESLVRILQATILIAYASWELGHNQRTETLAIYIAATYGLLSIVDSAFGTTILSFDPGTTLALLILVAIIYLATRDQHATGPVLAFSGFIAFYSIAIVIVADLPIGHSVSLLLLAVPGQLVIIWLVHRMILSLAHSSEIEAIHARTQGALASCSQVLLNRGTPEPLSTALEALLGATHADYAYIDVNRIDEVGAVTWEIVADARGDGYPELEVTYRSGDYDQLDLMEHSMRQGRPAVVTTSELPRPIRTKYEAEGIKAELVAPILIGDRWVGSVGYTDHIREGTWTEVEIEGLMRAAEMVGAYWEREAAREGLMELAQAKDQFIATVSHELRTPLAAVVGFAGEMVHGLERFSEDELREMATHIFTQSLEVTHLVDDLLSAERAASGNLTVRPTAVSMLDECNEIISTSMSSLNIKVVGDDVSVVADSLRTRQIMRNVLTNAVRHGGDHIEVRMTSRDGVGRIAVRDNGRGVRGVDSALIFDPYTRSQNGDTKPDSVGLGLSVARQLARLMEGDLVYRRSGTWTVFELTLPLAELDQPAFTA